ncbi:hypothetical protein V6N12_064968 [Hibiscus sabdariffa]|uniref:Glycosyltransferase n=1 Tax=Hibiscus sabdariffa TaxID=183260 RepID=A0ABR2G7H6_9ROSI
MIKLKKELYDEILDFQSKNIDTKTLAELMAMKSKWDLRVWVLSFGSPNEQSLKRIIDSYNNSRISFIRSSYDFKYYGRFQTALQTEADLVYILNDDMIPKRKMLQILSHVAGTEKYKNIVLGNIGGILTFRQKDSTFSSKRKFRSKEVGLYLPDPAYNITIDKIVQVDFLSSSWFLTVELVKILFIETPFTFMIGGDLHLRALTNGYVTQWATMYSQKIDALFYTHSADEVKALAPLLKKFRSTVGKKAYIVVSGAISALVKIRMPL